jgi:hypothetical protein
MTVPESATVLPVGQLRCSGRVPPATVRPEIVTDPKRTTRRQTHEATDQEIIPNNRLPVAS